MIDREKVIKGLRCLISMSDCTLCPYSHNKQQEYCLYDIREDVIELLKEQEPRVMPLANVMEWMGEIDELRDPVYWENRREQHESQWMLEAKNPLYMIEAIKKGVARVWTWKPTKEQSKAVKWE